MKNFILGLVIGVVLTLLLSVFFQKSVENSHVLNDKPYSNQETEQADSQANLQNKRPTKAGSVGTEIVASKKPQQERHSEKPELAEESVVADLNKANIIRMLNGFDQSDLARIQSIIENLNNSPIEEVFESEPIDSVWSLKKQSELEYAFYEKSALKDLGTLDSVECKSQTCLASIQVPADLELRPSYYMDWSSPVAVSIRPNEDDSTLRTVRIYISREK